MSISIVMPCYNEKDGIEEVVKTYYNEVISRIDDSELIVIDDCSKDATFVILERLKDELLRLKVMKTPLNSGHGKAMRMGYEAAQKEWVFQVDSDNQFEAKEFWKLYTLRGNYNFVLGFRKVRHDPLHRLVLTRLIRFMNLIFFGVWINDANCPFRLIKKQVLDELLKQTPREALAPNIIISILAKKKGIKMEEVPIAHYARKTGIVSINGWKLFKFSLKGLGQLIMFKRLIPKEIK
jgi:glycosyltransferase involved in cell wall biosynthesis